MVHHLVYTQLLKSDPDTIWKFMSSPANLALITPDYMGFKILSSAEDLRNMYPGQIIEYTVTPVFGIKMHWVTEITHVSEKQFFVDEQRFGPYKMWHHKHFIKAVAGGVEMKDVLHYKLPYGFLGRIVNAWYIKHKIKEIFDYRYQKLEELFNNGK